MESIHSFNFKSTFFQSDKLKFLELDRWRHVFEKCPHLPQMRHFLFPSPLDLNRTLFFEVEARCLGGSTIYPLPMLLHLVQKSEELGKLTGASQQNMHHAHTATNGHQREQWRRKHECTASERGSNHHSRICFLPSLHQTFPHCQQLCKWNPKPSPSKRQHRQGLFEGTSIIVVLAPAAEKKSKFLFQMEATMKKNEEEAATGGGLDVSATAPGTSKALTTSEVTIYAYHPNIASFFFAQVMYGIHPFNSNSSPTSVNNIVNGTQSLDR